MTLAMAGNDLWEIQAKDRDVVRLSCKLMKAEFTKASAAVGKVNIDVPAIALRREEVVALMSEVDEWKGKESLKIRPEWCGTLRTALAIQFDAVKKVEKSGEKLALGDLDAVATRIKQLDRLISALDVAGMGQPLPADRQPKERAVGE